MSSATDPGPQEFDAVIEANPTGPGAFVEIPFSVPDVFGVKGRVPVRAIFDHVHYRGSISPYGGRHLLGVLKDVQQQLGKGPGDQVHVTVRLDLEPRSVEVGIELEKALVDAGVLATFRGLSYSHQREYVRWVAQAKRAETWRTRVAKMIIRLQEGRPPA